MTEAKQRNSGIELLKIIAIFLIVISHVTLTLGQAGALADQQYVLALGQATADRQRILLMLLRQTGALGNTVFFVCSAWFLVGRQGTARKKAFSLLCTVWAVSILFLAVYLLADPSCLTKQVIIRQLLPTCFANNWYMTCYIIFLFLYPWLNKLISMLARRQLLRIVLFTSLLWILLNYLMGSWFFPSEVILWVTLYLLLAYLKTYCPQLMTSVRSGTVLLLIGIAGYVAQVVVTNYAGLHLIGALSDRVLRWNAGCSPFYIMIAVGSLILASRAKYQLRPINYLSGLSVYVYLFHENALFRNYTRPRIWQYLYTTYGYAHVVLLDLGFAAVLFLVSLLVCAVYKETLQRCVSGIADRLYPLLSQKYRSLEKRLLKIR